MQGLCSTVQSTLVLHPSQDLVILAGSMSIMSLTYMGLGIGSACNLISLTWYWLWPHSRLLPKQTQLLLLPCLGSDPFGRLSEVHSHALRVEKRLQTTGELSRGKCVGSSWNFASTSNHSFWLRHWQGQCETTYVLQPDTVYFNTIVNVNHISPISTATYSKKEKFPWFFPVKVKQF